MIYNSTILANFSESDDSSLEPFTKTIHNVWMTTGTINNSNMSFSEPQQDIWVYYSFFDDHVAETLYKSIKLKYDLQLNEWVFPVLETVNGNVRTSGLTTADLTNFTKLFESLPIIPTFSTDTASTDNSVNSLKTLIATYYSENANNLEIYNIWCRLADVEQQLVRCVVFVSISTVNGSVTTELYKTIVIYYNNDTNIWSISDPFMAANSSETDNKFSNVTQGEDAADYFMFYTTIAEVVNDTLIEKDKITYNGKVLQNQKLPRVGTVVMWGSDTAPNGAILCNGDPYHISHYPILFSVIGYRYGEGISSMYFKVPDFRNGYLFGSASLTNCTDYNPGSWLINKFDHYHMIDVTQCKYISSEENTIESPDNSRGNALHFNQETNQGLTAAANTGEAKQSYRPNYTLCNYIIYHD